VTVSSESRQPALHHRIDTHNRAFGVFFVERELISGCVSPRYARTRDMTDPPYRIEKWAFLLFRPT